MKTVIALVIIPLLLSTAAMTQVCTLKKKGMKVAGLCIKKKLCGRPSGASAKCKGKGMVCCDNTIPPCQNGGKCILKVLCKRSRRMGKCSMLPFKEIVCCRTPIVNLPICPNGSVCNLRRFCKEKQIVGKCGASPLNVAVCCKTGVISDP